MITLKRTVFGKEATATIDPETLRVTSGNKAYEMALRAIAAATYEYSPALGDPVIALAGHLARETNSELDLGDYKPPRYDRNVVH